MAKKNGWFGWVKRLFACKAKTKKGKEWRWDLGRFEHKRYPALTLTASQRTLSEAAEEQKKHALNVAIATAAAAEAAVAAAQAAAEVVRLTGASKSCQLFRKLDPSLAATKIQSAYRAHLARKALRALKGLVRLQAIVRGRAARRQIVASLKRLPSTRKRQQEVQEGSITIGDECSKVAENKMSLKPKKEFEEKELKVECRSQEGWDCSAHSKEDIEASWFKRKDALTKRERMKKYSFSHRERRNTYMLQESLTKKEYGTRSCRLEPWEGHEISKPIVYSNLSNREMHGRRQAKRQNASHRDSIEMLSPRFPFLRSSFHHDRRNSFEDESLLPSSPAFPTYMAVTESAKAKTRSMSIPKQRVGFWDGCLKDNYPRRNTVSLWSSYDSESIFHN